MRVDRCGFRSVVALASLLAVAMPTAPAEAQANRQAVSRPAPVIGLQCVPFARHLSGIDIVGNARTWWHQAEGRYERGSRPEVGSVLTFKPTGAMRLGHVSVVSQIVSAREILVDHANWPGPERAEGPGRAQRLRDRRLRRQRLDGRACGDPWPRFGLRPYLPDLGLHLSPHRRQRRRRRRCGLAGGGAAQRARRRRRVPAPAYVGQAGAGLDASDLLELADASVRDARPVRSPPAEPHQVAARDFGDDSLVWGAPHRSLR